MKVVVCAGGRFHALHLAQQLEQRGHLKNLYTAAFMAADKKNISELNVAVYKTGRFLDSFFEKARLSKIIPLSWWYQFKDNLFDRWVSKKMQKSDSIDLFIGWAHYVLQSLPEVKKRGALVVIESGSMHILAQQRILEDEYKKFNIKASPIDARIVQKILAEYQAADIIMVPAPHVAQSFIDQGIAAEKLRCVSYGVNLDRFFPGATKPSLFTVLFVGQVSLQKGVFYLLSAWQKLNLKNAQLCIVGMINQDFMPIYEQFKGDSTITFLGAVSQEKLAELYRQASIFVLPSLQEGIAMVQAEAMACGLPLICTTNSGGETFIENDDCGFVVPIRDAQALAEKISYFYKHPKEVEKMGAHAAQKIKQFSWDAYGQKVIEVYQKLLENK